LLVLMISAPMLRSRAYRRDAFSRVDSRGFLELSNRILQL
jgi:hypothetical protein